ncbi:uncharacterized protein [Apostichopus japonicus]|uniref:uncharacterized protein isoform X2 n=1 Tax=Stichopus japonicus TaxID=307972 RepID=UPI003AB25A73
MKRRIAEQLITKYPYLRERIGSGYDAWTAALNNKLKSLRMKDSSLSLKYAPLKRKESILQKDVFKRPCKGELNFLPVIPSTEDDTSLKGHKETMKKEMSKKGAKNLILIEKLMDTTYPQRRAYLTNKPLVKDLLQEYPALLLTEEISNEMTRLVNIDCTKKALKFPRLAKSITLLGKCYLKSVKSGPKHDKIKEILHRNIRSSEVDRTEEQNKAGLQLLPLLLRENEEDFVSYTNTSNEFQKIAESVSTPKILISESTCAIAAESQVVKEGDSVDSLIHLISMFYVVNIEYPRSCNCTLTYVQKEIFEITDNKKVPAKLVTFVTKVASQ